MLGAKKLSLIVFATATALFTDAHTTHAQKLTPQVTSAFDQYISTVEARDSQPLPNNKNFLLIDTQPDRQRTKSYSELKSGKVLIERTHSATNPAASGSLIHDWTATIFIHGVTLDQTLAALKDYDRDSDYYAPQVIQSKLLSKSGDRFHIALRLKQEYVFTAVLDTEYDILYTHLDAAHAASQSRSSRIAEIENAATSHEQIHTPGDDHGFLWRLNSYWHFVGADGGVYLQCNAISLTRDVPTGLNWLVGPSLEKIPRDSLRFTLSATRTALQKRFPAANAPLTNATKK
jgi:hypothetical protein